jgi:hypothetical protein
MHVNSRLVALFLLTVPLGCAPEPSPASDRWASAVLTPADSSGPSEEDVLGERASISASGRYVLVSSDQVGPAAATVWSDALDLPGDAVVATRLIGPREAADVFADLGESIKPIRGDSFVLLSTGLAGAPAGPEPGTDFAPGGIQGDSVALELEVLVPAGANRMSLQYNFLSSESPDFIGSAFNDTFSIDVVEGEQTRSFTLASVNSSQFFEVSNSRAKGSGFDIYTEFPSGVDLVFGTGLPDAGLTDFQSFHVDVDGTNRLRVVFRITDNGDGILDSAVLIDALQFSAIETLDPNPDLIAEGGTVTTNLDDLSVGGRPVRGAVADGVSLVLLRVEVPGPGDVTFSLTGSTDGALSTIGGAEAQTSISTRTATTAEGEFAFAVYRAPADFNRAGDEGLVERSVVVGASYSPAVGDAFTTQSLVQLRRPPLVLTQGPWSDSLDWRKQPLLDDATFAVTFADRAYSCRQELRVLFPSNQFVSCPWIRAPADQGVSLCGPAGQNQVDVAVKEALANVRRLGMAATQVDVVAHGAAGLDARQYINETSNYRTAANLRQGDINRLITLNTPHYGSPVADAIVDARARPARPSGDEFLCRPRLVFGTPVEPGDIDDLTTSNVALAATPVPSHAIVGTGGVLLEDEQVARAKLFVVQLLYVMIDTKIFPFRLGPERLLTNPSAVFQSRDHDLFVDVGSQAGGIDPDAVTEIEMSPDAPPEGVNQEDDWFDSDFFHSPGHPQVSVELKRLLNSPVGSAVFAEFPATPSLQAAASPAVPTEPAETAPEPSLLPENAALRIVSPASGTEVIAGEITTVEVAADNFTPHSVLVATESSTARSEAAPFTTVLRISREALGPVRLAAVAFDEEGDGAISDEVVLFVRTNAALQSVDIVSQDPVLFGLGTRRQLSVLGDYDDEVSRDITSSLVGTIYQSSNDQIVAVTPDGELIAQRSGVATVVARNGEVQDTITVTVTGNRAPLAVPSGDIALTCVLPGASVPVDLDGSGSFDPDGDLLQFSWFLGAVELATGPTATVALAAGLHVIQLVVTDSAGESAQATVTVRIDEDVAPVLTLLGDNPATAECGAPYVDSGATALDSCDGDLTAAVSSQSNVNTAVPGSYSVDYEVNDHLGLTATASRSVAVVDQTAPEVTVDSMTQLFPPGLAYRTFELSDCTCAEDACGGEIDIDVMGDIVAIHSDEPDITGPDDPGQDIVILGHSSFKLREQQVLPGNGRVYEVELTARDDRGNRTAPLSCFFGVKESRQSRKPINDGRMLTVRP